MPSMMFVSLVVLEELKHTNTDRHTKARIGLYSIEQCYSTADLRLLFSWSVKIQTNFITSLQNLLGALSTELEKQMKIDVELNTFLFA